MAQQTLADLLKGVDFTSGSSAIKPLDNLTDLANQPTAEDALGGQLEKQADQYQANTPLTAVLKGLTAGAGGALKGKAAQQRAEKIEAIRQQYEYQMQLNQHAQDVEGKLKTLQAAGIEQAQNQAAIDTAALSAIQTGDAAGINDLVNGKPAMKAVLADTLPAGTTFSGIKVVDGNVVAVGTDAQGNMIFGSQAKPISAFLSPDGQKALQDWRKGEANIRKTEADTKAAEATAANGGMSGYQQTQLEEQRRNRLNTDIEQYGKMIDSTGLTDLGTALHGLNQVMSKYKATDDLPGIGVTGGMTPNIFVGEAGRELRQAAIAIGNNLIKARSGAAVSNQEAARLAQELGLDISGDTPKLIGTNEDSFRRGMANAENLFNAKQQAVRASFSPEAVAEYDRRRAALSAPVAVEQLDLSKMSDADLEAIARGGK